ncbi:MAG: SPOR domain-containing protein, partial [Terriglobia bacterium]
VASASAPQTEAPSQPPATKPEELSFFDRLEGKPPAENLPAAPPKRSAPAASKAPPKPSPAPAKQAQASASESRAAPLYLQVAAVTQQPDAQRLARKLQKLGFSPVLRPPRSDRFYRVQVGPFATAELAKAAKSRLAAHGFKAFIRR